jgi:hypothetical protein
MFGHTGHKILLKLSMIISQTNNQEDSKIKSTGAKR